MTYFAGCDQGSLVGLCMQGYKSLCAAIMIGAAMVNIRTSRDVHPKGK